MENNISSYWIIVLIRRTKTGHFQPMPGTADCQDGLVKDFGAVPRLALCIKKGRGLLVAQPVLSLS